MLSPQTRPDINMSSVSDVVKRRLSVNNHLQGATHANRF